VLAGRVVNLGQDHALTLLSKWNLAVLLKGKLGDVLGGIELLRQVVKGAERNLDARSSQYVKYAQEDLPGWERELAAQ